MLMNYTLRNVCASEYKYEEGFLHEYGMNFVEEAFLVTEKTMHSERIGNVNFKTWSCIQLH